MSRIINFPAERIAKGVYNYTPEMGKRKPNCQMRASLSYYGRHYFVDTPLTLKGRGITFIKTHQSKDLTAHGQYLVGWNQYQVTIAAYEKLKEKYSISHESNLD